MRSFFKIFISFFITFAIVGATADAASSCGNLFAITDGAEGVVPVKLSAPSDEQHSQPILLKEGETFWGFYECSKCGSEDQSMKPNRENQASCTNCGSPHTDEAYHRPALFEKDGNLYLVSVDQLSRTQQEKTLAKDGKLIGCPFCGADSFDINVSCPGCGAMVRDPKDLQAQLRAGITTKNQLRSSTASAQGDPSTSKRIRKNSESSDGYTPGLPQSNKMTPRAKAILGMAAGISMTVATTLGVVWGNTTHSEVGRVVKIESAQVLVEYKVNGQSFTIDLQRPKNEILQWRIGEPITLSFINWSLGNPSGGLRGNGDALGFQK